MSETVTRIQFLTSQNSIFRILSPQIETNLKKQKIILASHFSFCSFIIDVYLYESCLKLIKKPQNQKEKLVKLYLNLNYSIKASQITEKKDDPFAKKIGFSLFQDQTAFYNFYSSDSSLLDQWMSQLAKIIVLTGFSYQYKSIRYVGRGQFAQVWEVQRIRDGVTFAAKIFDKDLCFGQVNGQQSVYNEIQILKKINHPNIVHLECIFESQRNIYMILEYVKGQLLSDFIKNKKKALQLQDNQKSQNSNKQNNIKIMLNLLKAVNYLHNNGIAHRDLKPANIIVNQQNCNAFIIDFGLSEVIDKQKMLFEYCGSPGYMAPQIFSPGNNLLDLKKCDIFSLGAIFYFILTNQPLFTGNSAEQIVDQTTNSRNWIKKKINSQLKGQQSKFLTQMLNVDPLKRITAQEALHHQYFVDIMYDYLQIVRKSITQSSSKNSLNQNNVESKFQELFSESMVVFEHKFEQNLDFIKQNNYKINIVTPSKQFNQKIKSRSKRFMSEENIQVQFQNSKNQTKLSKSGIWKNFIKLQMILKQGSFWPVKDLNVFA